MNTATVWRTAIRQLDNTVMDGVTRDWLRNAHLEEDYGAENAYDSEGQEHRLTLQVPSDLANDIITSRWLPFLEDMLKDITGEIITLTIAHAFEEESEPEAHTKEPLDHEILDEHENVQNRHEILEAHPEEFYGSTVKLPSVLRNAAARTRQQFYSWTS